MSIADKINYALIDIKNHVLEINDQVCGKKVTILSGFNGQPHGRSRKSLKGSIQTVKRATYDGGSIWLWLEDVGQCWCAIGVDEVEFLCDCGDTQ